MQVGSVVRNYKVLNVLRPGSGGNVYVAENLNAHEIVVLKSSFFDQSKRAEFENVNLAWKSLSDMSEFVVKFKEFFYEGNYSYTVMEYCSGGDLQKLINKRKLENSKFTEFEAVTFIHDVCCGLNILHTLKRLLHRDIKPGNILITADGHGKLADFNISRFLTNNDQQTMTMGGSQPYTAAEIIRSGSYSFSSDMFAVGAVLYELLALTPCFTSFQNILENSYVPLDPALGYSAGLCELARRLLSADPAQRPSAAAVVEDPVVVRTRLQGVEAALAALQQKVIQQQQTISALHQTVGTLQGTVAGLVQAAQAVPQRELRDDSADVEKIIPPLVSATDKGFVITGSSYNGFTREPFQAFTQKPGCLWATTQNQVHNSWVNVEMPREVKCNTVTIRLRSDAYMAHSPTEFSVLGSADGIVYQVLADIVTSWSKLGEEKRFRFENDSSFLHYKLRFHANLTGGYNAGYIAVGAINFGYLKRVG